MKKSSRIREIFKCILLLAIILHSAYSQDVLCCAKSNGSCRNACEKMSLASQAATSTYYLHENLRDVRRQCPADLIPFWQCMNQTINEIINGQQWVGRNCCSHAQSMRCRHACLTSSSQNALQSQCRPSDEMLLYACIDRLEYGESCCDAARTPDCQQACMNVFTNAQTSNQLRDHVVRACESRSAKVLLCVKNFTKLTPFNNAKKYLHCCERSESRHCQDTCRSILNVKTSHQEIVDSLTSGGCGPPLPYDKLWQCFLSATDSSESPLDSSSRIDRVGMDSAKLQCCSRASTAHCRRLCSKTFGTDWTKFWDQFDEQCLAHIQEHSMTTCINEVEEPCELGCDALSYCTNFNNRPTQLFRSCTREADEAARFDVDLWQLHGNVSILPNLHLPIKNISTCSPHVWKAIACTLQIQPCARNLRNQICRDDCLDILSQCMDWTRMPSHVTSASICRKLSTDDSNECVSLKTYLQPSDYVTLDDNPTNSITTPCKRQPCANDQLCLVNHNCLIKANRTNKKCLPYTCINGCRLGEVSQLLVPEGSYVRIPVTYGKNGCLKICKCVRGNIEECEAVPCIVLDSCQLGNRKIEHATSFYVDCNICSCYAGEIVCSKRQCHVALLGGNDPNYTSLPCNCPPHYVPVCARNGNTYPNSCLAKCAALGDADYEFGPCNDPCENVRCANGEMCVPDAKVCLSLLHSPCLQHQCVNVTSNECTELHEPICDHTNRQYSKVCQMERHHLSYRGACLRGCHTSETVCGINGVTYASECAAWADFVSVDYVGQCSAVGLISDVPQKQCKQVQCPALAQPNCPGYTPPGACCPVCGGAIKLLFSRKQIDRALYALRAHTNALTLHAILRGLQRHVRVGECVVRGYLTIESDVFVMVQSSERRASRLQIDACVREAEKLASLIRAHSPRITTDLSLSALTSATCVHAVVPASCATRFQFLALLLFFIASPMFLLR